MEQLEPTGELSYQQPPKGEYRSFLVRLWQSHAEGAWHVSVQSVQTGTTLHFADLNGLFAFLGAETAHDHTAGEGDMLSGVTAPAGDSAVAVD